VLASLHAAAGFVEATSEVDDMCAFTNLADLEWELFLEGLGNDYPSDATADVPAPIRNLFVAHAKKADSAVADFHHELRRGESRQDELKAELCVHRLQTFKAVQNDTAALKHETNTLKRQLELMAAAARKSEEKVAMLIATLKEIQDHNVSFGRDIEDIGRKLTPTLDVALPGLPVTPPAQEKLPTRDAIIAGRSVSVGPDIDGRYDGVGHDDGTGRYDCVGHDGFDPLTDTPRFAPKTGIDLKISTGLNGDTLYSLMWILLRCPTSRIRG
jgi:hypothetical protein